MRRGFWLSFATSLVALSAVALVAAGEIAPPPDAGDGDAGGVVLDLVEQLRKRLDFAIGGHGDHADAAPALAALTGATVLGPEGIACVDVVLRDGASYATDTGELVAVHTPGHTLCLLRIST